VALLLSKTNVIVDPSDGDVSTRNWQENTMKCSIASHTRMSGFRISPLHSFIGASPDGYVSCSRWGSGVIEMKCPFSVKDLSVNEAANSVAHFCLEKDVQG